MSPPSLSTPPSASFTSAEDLLSSFKFERVLSEDSRALVLYLLGSAVPPATGERFPMILKVEKTPYSSEPAQIAALSDLSTWSKLEMMTTNDIYSTLLAWYAPGNRSADHIKKYSVQSSCMLRETPELYRTVVEPYIESLPAGQTGWVHNILEGKSEAENVLFRDTDPETGFVLTPDLKWDQKTLNSLYLLVLTQTRTIRSLRDLRPSHLPLLRKIRDESRRAIREKYGVKAGELRMFIHYQPTYYHFHVHVTHVSYVGFPGITVGQAHLLDDVIDNLELDLASNSPSPSYYERRTLTYALGSEHGLFASLSEPTA
ncbi:m7GpppX diphosphatase, partial [Phenoliferia sp. Uapishka_3]